MRLRYAGRCRDCGRELPAGTTALYDRGAKCVYCLACGGNSTESSIDTSPGVAGSSARREFQRRSQNRESRIRQAHPHLGGLLLALSTDPQSTTSWAQGASGEAKLGRRLDALSSRGVHVLHDRRISGSRANIDHIAVGSSGVFVVDAKKYRGTPTLRVEGGLFRLRTSHLFVGLRNRDQLVAGVLRQTEVVASALADVGLEYVPVRGMLCFVDSEWPLLANSFYVDEVEVLWPKKAADRITSRGALSLDDRERTVRALAARFVPA